MERPVTDIVFVCTLDKVPAGYTAVENCPCGHSAQLWEKVMGGEAGTRYLCYTKENQNDDDMVIEDAYIPGSSQQYLKKGYQIITDTVEGEEPMRHKQLAIKKVHRSNATKVIVDIIICRSRDSISKLYTKLTKVNGCQIAFRTAKYVPGSESDPVANVSSALDKLDVSQNNHSINNSGSQKTEADEVVQVKMVDSLASSPPPPLSPTQPSPQAPPTSAPFGGSGPTPPPSTNQSATPPSGTSYPSPNQPTPSPQPPASVPALSSNYPPAPSYPSSGSSYSNSSVPYQMNPAAPAQITPFGGAGYMGGAAYDTSIGFSFGGGGTPSPSYNPSLPAPYNPYNHQQPQQASPGYPPASGYPPAPGYSPYPPTQGNPSWGKPQGGQNQGGGIGFNI